MRPGLGGGVCQRSQLSRQALKRHHVVARAIRYRPEPAWGPHAELCRGIYLAPPWGKLNPRGEGVKVTVTEESAIEISWSSRKLEKVCTDDRQAVRRWGTDNWKILRRRLAALLAAPTLADMTGVPGNCHQLHADRAGEFAISLWGSYRLIFEPAHNPFPALTDGGVDRALVTKIEIKEVVDYHGQ